MLAGAAIGMQHLALIHASGNVFGNRRTEKFFDITGSLTYFSLVIISISAAGLDKLTPRQILLATLVLIWAARLGIFLYCRIEKHGGVDPRFDRSKKYFCDFYLFWCVQVCATMYEAIIRRAATNCNSCVCWASGRLGVHHRCQCLDSARP